MNNYKMTVQYEGTRYKGWQRQATTEDTIQGKIEKVLSKMLETKIEIDGASRTDAGVHAMGQIANFKTQRKLDEQEILDYVNKYLTEDIAVTKVEKVPEKFHSRLNSKAKRYRYVLNNSNISSVFDRKFCYQYDGFLDVERMEEAIGYLIGKQDFKSFCGNRKMKKSTVREIYDIEIIQDENKITFEFYGTGFLQYMIRIITGTLIEVGRAERSADEIPAVLASGERNRAGFLAPASGLTLLEVEY